MIEGDACWVPDTSVYPPGPHYVDGTGAGEGTELPEGGLSPRHSLRPYQAASITFGAQGMTHSQETQRPHRTHNVHL